MDVFSVLEKTHRKYTEVVLLRKIRSTLGNTANHRQKIAIKFQKIRRDKLWKCRISGGFWETTHPPTSPLNLNPNPNFDSNPDLRGAGG